MNLPIELIVVIFSYLKLDELCKCEKVCKNWYNILLTSNSSNLYQVFDFRKQNIENSLNWIKKKLEIHRPSHFNFSGCNIRHQLLKLLLKQIQKFVEFLDISFQHLIFEDYLELDFTKLQSIIVNDAKLKDNSLEALLNIGSLKELNINYNSSLSGKPFFSSKKALTALSFEGCEHIEYIYIFNYVRNHGIHLKELGIDGEYYNSEEVCNILQCTPNLLKFAIEYANEMDDRIGIFLIKSEWEKLKIRRALLMHQDTFANIFNINLSRLSYLNLAECNSIDDSICILISSNCKNINSFILTWSTDVTDQGINSIVSNCNYLHFLDLTGLKDITDVSFPLDNLQIYSNLETIILEKCNKITDNHLWNLSSLYPKIKIKRRMDWKHNL